MKLHTCHISLGSNVSAAYIRLAREQLTCLFPDILFGREVCTLPVGLSNPAYFTNQTACFTTILTPGELRPVLKHLEKRAGRNAKEVDLEIIRLDVDLVKYDNQILKTDEWNRLFSHE